MELFILIVFALGYFAITMEHSLKIDKLVPALSMMTICWAAISLGHLEVFEVDTALKKLIPTHIEEILLHHLGKTAEILIFLMGAMTIVEIIDYFSGFAMIKKIILTKSKTRLLWIFAVLAFLLSAIIDNLTATIVLISILRKLVDDKKLRIWFAGLIVISANAGGAWSPIGDVTTTMLWIGNKVSAQKLVLYLLLPSAVCMLVPTLIASFLPIFKGRLSDVKNEDIASPKENPHAIKILLIGIGAIVFVPVFKTVTHLPPYLGMMFSLSVVGVCAEIFNRRAFYVSDLKDVHQHSHSPVHSALARIELPSILFFLGILLAVAALESLGMLFHFAENLNQLLPKDLLVLFIGTGSAVIDNVPLVAASMGMFSEGLDDFLWHFIAFSAGTGGSMLIIGSAAGVVAMGMEQISFFWYLKKIAWLALIGFISGALIFITMRDVIFI